MERVKRRELDERRRQGQGAGEFPSIDKKYGQPIVHWKALIRAQSGLTCMQIVAYLKETQGVDHGHADALVADTLAEDRKV